jgi:hypothetical protein
MRILKVHTMCIYSYIHACITHIHTHLSACARIHIHMYTCIYVYTHTYINTKTVPAVFRASRYLPLLPSFFLSLRVLPLSLFCSPPNALAAADVVLPLPPSSISRARPAPSPTPIHVLFCMYVCMYVCGHRINNISPAARFFAHTCTCMQASTACRYCINVI